MISTQTSAAVRATAAALAVFATMVTLNGVVSIAEPQHGGWMAQEHTRLAAATPSKAVVIQGAGTPAHL